MTFGKHLKTLRLTQGIPAKHAARTARVSREGWLRWERDAVEPKFHRAPEIAAALGIPVAQLFTDEYVLAELRLSEQTIADVKASGRPAAHEAALRIAQALEPLIWQHATQPPVDLTPGARPKPRRTRVDKLKGVAQANAMRAAAIERRKQAAIDAEP